MFPPRLVYPQGRIADQSQVRGREVEIARVYRVDAAPRPSRKARGR